MDESRSGDNAADLALEMVGCNKVGLRRRVRIDIADGAFDAAGVPRRHHGADLSAEDPGMWQSGIDGDIDDVNVWQEVKEESFDVVLLTDALAASRGPTWCRSTSGPKTQAVGRARDLVAQRRPLEYPERPPQRTIRIWRTRAAGSPQSGTSPWRRSATCSARPAS